MGNEIERVQAARTLDDLHAVADDFAREKTIRPVITKLKRSNDWRDLGALKTAMISY